MKYTLKRCPFCGSSANLEEVELLPGGSEYCVTCSICRSTTCWCKTRTEAINKWNRREGSEIDVQSENRKLSEFSGGSTAGI